MFDFWSLIVGVIIGVVALTLVQSNKWPDDDPEYWFKQPGRRSGDK